MGVIALLVLAVLPAWSAPAPPRSPHAGHPARCADQSEAEFPRAFTSRGNLVVGPLSMIGAGRRTSATAVRELGGNKFPLLVRAGHTVTVEVAPPATGSASLFYARGGSALSETRVSDGDRAVTFRACSSRRAKSDADGRPVTFWSGFVLVSGPQCVPLTVWVDRERRPRQARIALGRGC